MRSTIICTTAICLLAGTPAHAADFTGPRLEAHAGWERVRFDQRNGINAPKDDGAFYGLSAGYDLPLGKGFVAGVEAGFDLASVSAASKAGAVERERKIKWDMDVAARVGAIVAPGMMLYVKAGYSRLRAAERDKAVGTTGTTISKSHQMHDGLRLGAGAEVNLSSNVYAKAEYRYTAYDAEMQRHQLLSGVGVRF